MVFQYAFVLPLTVSILVPITCFVTYTIAVCLDHVSPVFPYISETGTFAPESCIFSLSLNVTAFLLFFVMYIKHHQIREFSILRPDKAISPRRNQVATVIGIISCVGLDLVANFQESNVIHVHLIGAGACFLGGTIYFFLQTTFSRQMCPEVNTSRMVTVRWMLSVLCVISTITAFVPAIISVIQFDGEDRRKWSAEDAGYVWHLVSSISEWTLAFAYCIFFATFVPEFTKIQMHSTVLKLTNLTSDTNSTKENDKEI